MADARPVPVRKGIRKSYSSRFTALILRDANAQNESQPLNENSQQTQTSKTPRTTSITNLRKRYSESIVSPRFDQINAEEEEPNSLTLSFGAVEKISVEQKQEIYKREAAYLVSPRISFSTVKIFF